MGKRQELLDICRYWWRVVCLAGTNTWIFFGFWQVWGTAIFFGIGFAINSIVRRIWPQFGGAKPMDELEVFVYYVLAPLGALAIIAFVFNVLRAAMCLDREATSLAEVAEKDRDEKVAKAAMDNQQLRQEFDDRLPKFAVGFDEIAIGRSVSHGNAVGITVIAHVRNLGGPSIASRWNLHIRLKNGSVIEAAPEAIPREMHLFVNAGVSPIFIPGQEQVRAARVVKQDDALYEKTAKPIDRGSLVRGVLLFLAHDVQQDSFLGAVLELSCTDIHDKRWLGTHAFPEVPEASSPKHFPGMSMPE